MTPDEARDLLEGTTPGPWKWRWDTGLLSIFGAKGESVATDLDVQDADLAAAAPVLAAMIAGMREEWGVSYRSGYTGDELTDWGYDTRDEAEKRARNLDRVRGVHMYVYGIVRRYVTTEEEIS